ncbi:hypothetical protein KSD_82720 [Ktedonobacter sp. SOSP1-85]|nr:hypothetical protein KSD_82720 [Ktedonobacter sp. SOSP1-85]
MNTLSAPIATQPLTDYVPGVTPLTRENGFRRFHPPQGAHSAWPRRPPLEMWMLGQFLRNYQPLVAEHLLWGSDPAAYRLEADAGIPDPWRVLADPGEKNRGTNPHLRSCKYTGYGIILRADVDLPSEIAVVLQQVDRGPNYRWGIGGENSSGTLYYYANGRAYSGHGREDIGDRQREDLVALSTFGVWKDGTFRTIGENVLEQPFYDLEIAQYAEIVARSGTPELDDSGPLQDNYALPEYRSRSVLLVGSDYIVTYDAIVPGQRCAWSWFTLTKPTGRDANSFAYLPDQLPFIRAVRGVVQDDGAACIVQTSTSRGIRLESELDGSASNVLVVVSHREDLQVADGASTPWGVRITTARSTDYVFRYQGEIYYQPQEIQYAADGLLFMGTAGPVPYYLVWEKGLDQSGLLTSAPLRCLEGNWPVASNGQDVVIVMSFQPSTQIKVASIDRISHHPGDGNRCFADPLDHLCCQFGFGLEVGALRDMSSVSAISVLAPIQGQIQLSINERVSASRDVAEKDSHLTVLNLPSVSAILAADSSGCACPVWENCSHR